jgi:uncharacterized YccA/Bax inhibitor family protein
VLQAAFCPRAAAHCIFRRPRYLPRMIRTSNPTLSPQTFQQPVSVGEQRMTIQGAVNKTAILLAICSITAVFTWNRFGEDARQVVPLMIGGSIGGLIMALITCFKKEWSAATAPIYAVCEGLFIGGISALFNAKWPGIVMQAAMLTFGTLFAMLAAYRSGFIRATEKFKMGVVAATGGICLMYLVGWILSMFGMNMSFLYGNGMLSIGISVVVVVVAALNLVLDFDLIEQGASVGAPKYLEWYSGFSLLVTLVWLYIEILRLLAKLNSRRD